MSCRPVGEVTEVLVSVVAVEMMVEVVEEEDEAAVDAVGRVGPLTEPKANAPTSAAAITTANKIHVSSLLNSFTHCEGIRDAL